MKSISMEHPSSQQMAASERTGSPPLFVVGIDLGTTNSVMAIAGLWDDDTHRLPVPDGMGKSPGLPSGNVPVRLLKLPQRNLDGTIVEHVLFPSVVFQADTESPQFVGMGAKEAKFTHTKGKTVFYSVKRDLGTDIDPLYPRAVSPDLNTPVKVSAAILRAMREAAETVLGCSLADIPTIVTIPASFQSAQRRDTLAAARLAGLNVDEGCLFDEPNAALLAYINRQRAQLRWDTEETVLVFDFGGGTCDVSIVDVSYVPSSKRLHLRNLALSRYEELGGDDIDNYIVHQYLAEQFYRASGCGPREWSLSEKRDRIWSQLAKVAELLKIRFSEELEKVTQAKGWDENVLRSVQIAIPPQVIHTKQGEILMSDLSMNWETFQKLLSPFINPDCSDNTETEHYRVTSIFTPIQETLDKGRLKVSDITRVLLVGGSSLNPLIEKALQEYFPDAKIERPESMDFLVGEGAAVYAYWRFLVGHDVLAPILGDTIGLLAEGEQFVPLVRAGAPIPYPEDGEWITYNQFRVPRDFMYHVDLVICAGSKERPVHIVKLDFGETVPRDTQVHLKIRFDGNKIFHLQAYLPQYPQVRVEERIDNPLAQTPLTELSKKEMELKKVLHAAQASGTIDQHVDDMVSMAQVYYEMDRPETALEWLKGATSRRGKATPEMQVLAAHCHFRLGEVDQAHLIWAKLAAQYPRDVNMLLGAAVSAPDAATAEDFARRAVAADPGNGQAQYVLAQVMRKKGDYASARACLEKARGLFEDELSHFPERVWILACLADIYEAFGNTAKAVQLREARERQSAKGTLIDTRNLVGLAKDLARL